MSQQYFDIEDLSNKLWSIIVGEIGGVRIVLKDKITSCLQRNIDKKLVPKNWSLYISRKKWEKWIRHIEANDIEKSYYIKVLRQLTPNIDFYFSEVDEILVSKGLKKPKGEGIITCYYCERKVDAAKFGGEVGVFSTKDHVIPKSKFGKSDHTNLVNACNECNVLKSDLTLQNFIYKVQSMMDKKVSFMTIPFASYPVIIRNSYNLLIIQSAK